MRMGPPRRRLSNVLACLGIGALLTLSLLRCGGENTSGRLDAAASDAAASDAVTSDAAVSDAVTSDAVASDGVAPLDGSANGDAAASADAALPGPDPACRVADVSGEAITWGPGDPTPGSPFWIQATGPTPRTNVVLRLCTPTGAVAAPFANVTGSYTWEFHADAGVPAGVTQVIFSADPGDQVYSTRLLTVTAAPPTDGGLGDGGLGDGGLGDGGVSDAGPPQGLCDLPAGDLLGGAGDFEGGMSGQAPAGWQVRDPSAPGACAGSGTAAQHVHLAASAAACGGQALVVDARGQWDCYAVQIFTGYNTIQGGHTYRLSAAVQAESQNNPAAWFVLGLQWLDAGDAVFGDEKNPQLASVNYGWTRLSWTLVAPANARRAVVWLSAHFPGRVTYDKVSLAQVN